MKNVLLYDIYDCSLNYFQKCKNNHFGGLRRVKYYVLMDSME